MTALPYPAFQLSEGTTPLLVSIPHAGLHLTAEVESALTPKAQKLPDTDWYLPELYDFLAELGVGVLQANYSRYVIDLNRPVDDQPLYSSKTTGLFPTILFDESPVFEPGREPSQTLRQQYKEQIWQPYHTAIAEELARLKAQFGYALLFDAHSIAAEVPMLFDGKLPDFNWGTNNGLSCSEQLAQLLTENLGSGYSQVVNGRFKGGYITREFGQPDTGIEAVQLELSQATYLDQIAQTNGEYCLSQSERPAIQSQLKQLIEAMLSYQPGESVRTDLG